MKEIGRYFGKKLRGYGKENMARRVKDRDAKILVKDHAVRHRVLRVRGGLSILKLLIVENDE